MGEGAGNKLDITYVGLVSAFAVLILVLFVFVNAPGAAADDVVECWKYSTQSLCTTSGSGICVWKTDSWGSWCERPTCFDGDDTNASYCQNQSDPDGLYTLYNLTCGWEIYGTNLCDPNGTAGQAGNYFGSGCRDFDGDGEACYGTFFCEWNATDSTCWDPPDWNDDYVPVTNPGCGALIDQATCNNVTGCTWDGTACSGNSGGITCSQLNKTICADFTMLSTCCSWNGTSCTTSFDQQCYTAVPDLAAGKQFCEDYLVFTNQTACEEIAGTPWYMPCKFNQSGKNECHFNSNSFGGASGFGEMGTQKGCEAAGGKWITEQFFSGGNVKTDSWCEFKYGFENSDAGNCDTACWACETGASVANGNTSSQAESSCENSDLGYCEFRSDSKAQNGLGWCEPKKEFISGGGKSCKDDCAACEFLQAPQTQCQDSQKGCTWVADTNAPNSAGFCYGNSAKYCGNDCWSCYTQSDCLSSGNGGGGACNWDAVGLYCKPSGHTGEVCFDGKDNDNDAKIDCLDADCSSDKFCGGDDLGTSFGDCPSFPDYSQCTANSCVWLNDTFEEKLGTGDNSTAIGHCDFPGAQCWQHDDNETACGDVSDCSYIAQASAFCSENSTLFDNCFEVNNQTGCLTNFTGCGWITDTYNTNGGRCEPLVFAQCFGNTTRHQNQANCEQNESVGGVSTKICSWTADTFGFNPNGGVCGTVCYDLAGTNESCVTPSSGLCALENGFCEPDNFGGKCYSADGNETWCTGLLNQTCSWATDPKASNNVSVGNNSGWCDPKGAGQFVNFIGEMEPVIIGTDDNETTINASWNIEGVGLRDEFNKLVLGSRLQGKFESSATCNNVPTYSAGALGTGRLNTTAIWYLDSDGNTTGNCNSTDNSSIGGFEFKLRYEGNWDDAVEEKKTAFQCVQGQWGYTPVPMMGSKSIMCDLVGGPMAGMYKSELFKFKGLYNKSKDLRIYAVVGNDTTNDSNIVDSAGPFYYSQGSVDFKFEDCADTGADADGDGISAANDPDCFAFFKFGFVPLETGFMCGDGVDNDADGEVDCADGGCSYSLECGGTGSPTADVNDNTAPKLVWMKTDTYPDAAFVMYDTNEPANGTLAFYNLNSSCTSTQINKTIRDIGLIDTFVPTYKMWHDGPIDNYAFNPEKLTNSLATNTTYFYKTTVCDINGNCAVSACLNFTTKTGIANCKACTSTLKFPFTPPSGVGATGALGNLSVKIIHNNGTTLATIDPGQAGGAQLNYTDTKNFNLEISNPSVNNASKWKITLVNASLTGKVSSSVQNFSGGSDLQFNTTSNASFIGMDSTKCLELVNALRPNALEIGVPGNRSELWQCSTGLNCTDKTANATKLLYNVTENMTIWRVPADWGC